MNIGKLRKLVAAILQKETSYFTQNGEDLILDALNDARRTAEKLHDFAHNHVMFELSVDPTSGGNLDDATVVDPEAWQDGALPKSVETFYMLTEDSLGLIPLYHHAKKNVAVWTKERNHRYRRNDKQFRYPDDKQLPINHPPFSVMLSGRKVELQPSAEAAKTLRIEGQLWMPEYTADEDTDWMTEYGSDYLKFAAVCACNMFTQTFVAGPESMGPPTKDRDIALNNLVTWDADWMMNGRQPGAIRV